MVNPHCSKQVDTQYCTLRTLYLYTLVHPPSVPLIFAYFIISPVLPCSFDPSHEKIHRTLCEDPASITIPYYKRRKLTINTHTSPYNTCIYPDRVLTTISYRPRHTCIGMRAQPEHFSHTSVKLDVLVSSKMEMMLTIPAMLPRSSKSTAPATTDAVRY